MTTEETSVEILERYRLGDSQAADELFARYVGRLTLLARSRLSPSLARRTDPEDVVLSAYRSFFIRARDGQLTLARSGDLWRLLVAITLHKVYRQARKQRAERRALAARELESSWAKRLQLSRDPSPAEAVALADELQAIFVSSIRLHVACWNCVCRIDRPRRSPTRSDARSARSAGLWPQFANVS